MNATILNTMITTMNARTARIKTWNHAGKKPKSICQILTIVNHLILSRSLIITDTANKPSMRLNRATKGDGITDWIARSRL